MRRVQGDSDEMTRTMLSPSPSPPIHLQHADADGQRCPHQTMRRMVPSPSPFPPICLQHVDMDGQWQWCLHQMTMPLQDKCPADNNGEEGVEGQPWQGRDKENNTLRLFLSPLPFTYNMQTWTDSDDKPDDEDKDATLMQPQWLRLDSDMAQMPMWHQQLGHNANAMPCYQQPQHQHPLSLPLPHSHHLAKCSSDDDVMMATMTTCTIFFSLKSYYYPCIPLYTNIYLFLLLLEWTVPGEVSTVKIHVVSFSTELTWWHSAVWITNQLCTL